MRDNARAVRLRIGRNVRRLRLLQGKSQEALAESVGNSNKHIGEVERGKTNITIDVLAAIAAGLSVNITDLFGPVPSKAARRRFYTITQWDLDQARQALRGIAKAKRARRRR